MMTGHRRLTKSLDNLNTLKQNNSIEFPGILGAQFKGQTLVEVPNRAGFVYVRLRSNTSEVVQAYNGQVSPVFGLPVTLVRDSTNNRYIIKGRDLGQYGNWGDSSFSPRHASQHSFPEYSWGGDIVWVYGRQFVPLLVSPPSGTSGGNNVFVNPYVYYLDGIWNYAGGVATASLLGYKPTNGNAKAVLVYLDSVGNVQVLAGSEFSSGYTTINTMLPYLPALPDGSCVPLGAIRLVSGTSAISWNEIFDLRPLIDWWSSSGTSSGGSGSGVRETIITFPGALTVSYSPLRIYNKLGASQTISQVFLSVGTAPTGDVVTVDIHKDGTTIFTNQAHRPEIAAGNTTGYTTDIDVNVWADGSYLVAYVDNIGSGAEGSDLVVHIIHS